MRTPVRIAGAWYGSAFYNRSYNQRHTRLQIGAYAVGVVEIVDEVPPRKTPGAHVSRYNCGDHLFFGQVTYL